MLREDVVRCVVRRDGVFHPLQGGRAGVGCGMVQGDDELGEVFAAGGDERG